LKEPFRHYFSSLFIQFTPLSEDPLDVRVRAERSGLDLGSI
jgi:hypothetical protein